MTGYIYVDDEKVWTPTSVCSLVNVSRVRLPLTDHKINAWSGKGKAARRLRAWRNVRFGGIGGGRWEERGAGDGRWRTRNA